MDPIEHIRKLAAAENGKRYLEQRFGPVQHDAVSVLRMQKAASVSDSQLLKIASRIAGDTDALEVYESLGGKHKHAFGTPMFQTTSAGGGASPGSAGAASSVAKVPTPTSGVQQAPTPQAPSAGQVQPPGQQGQQSGQSPKIKVQLQPQSGATQGTSVSVG